VDGPAELRVALSRVHAPVTTLGPGRRAGIWFQGCSIRCRGCVSQDTWVVEEDRSFVDVANVVRWVVGQQVDGPDLDGVTISGGEPFDQPGALAVLAAGLRAAVAEWDLLVYSGYPLGTLRRRHPALLKSFDAVLTGPFVAGRPTSLPWRGSANQVLTLLTERARERYADVPGDGPALQIGVDGGRVWLTGIPRRDDMERFERMLLDRGVAFEEVSWRA
jgi:anaerobic ribonucleoside-triphosphate reductase activating protein